MSHASLRNRWKKKCYCLKSNMQPWFNYKLNYDRAKWASTIHDIFIYTHTNIPMSPVYVWIYHNAIDVLKEIYWNTGTVTTNFNHV